MWIVSIDREDLWPVYGEACNFWIFLKQDFLKNFWEKLKKIPKKVSFRDFSRLEGQRGIFLDFSEFLKAEICRVSLFVPSNIMGGPYLIKMVRDTLNLNWRNPIGPIWSFESFCLFDRYQKTFFYSEIFEKIFWIPKNEFWHNQKTTKSWKQERNEKRLQATQFQGMSHTVWVIVYES